ncbi:hypothetical protein QJS10_CPA01g03020 [Acorus calamus]|uniref:HMA domain-containing protein n=1 Tax=Acorus calamus TaxID=4465 RepID=A0AAV9FKN1_ACOCL|nr:hypothetical protein QJS10_CPA01g03020 [Acorus calamus]
MTKRTVLRVDVSCQKCKRQLLLSVSKLEGVDKMEIDAGKSTLVVTGDADPIDIIVQTRKKCKYAQVITIGPPPDPPKSGGDQKKKEKEEKKPNQKAQSKAHIHDPSTCIVCEQMGLHRDDPLLSCSIM